MFSNQQISNRTRVLEWFAMRGQSRPKTNSFGSNKKFGNGVGAGCLVDSATTIQSGIQALSPKFIFNLGFSTLFCWNKTARISYLQTKFPNSTFSTPQCANCGRKVLPLNPARNCREEGFRLPKKTELQPSPSKALNQAQTRTESSFYLTRPRSSGFKPT